MRDASYFEEYSNNNVVFYFLINKNLDQKNSLSKLAFAIQRDKENKILKTEIFDAEDKQIKIPKGLEKFLKISEQDAPKRPMGLMSKLKFNLASEKEVLSLMNDRDDYVRYQVAKRIAVEHLPKMMNDENSNVRWEVAARVGSEGGAFADEHLPMMMNDESYSVRWEVAKRIGSEGGAFAIEHLPKMMNDNHSYVRLKVAERIASEGGAFASEHLPKMMNDNHSHVRREVAKRIGDEGGAFADRTSSKNDE
jgi:HEAT repeat protein